MYAPAGMGGFFSIVGKVLKTGAAVASGNPVAIAGAAAGDIPHGKKKAGGGKAAAAPPPNALQGLSNTNLALAGVGTVALLLALMARKHRR